VARANGFEVRVTSGWRSRATQTKLYNDYLKGLAQYPAAPPGTSDHEKGLAIDVLSTDVQKLVDLLTSVGLVWQGPADPIHFSMPLGSSRTNKVTSPQPAPAPKGKSVLKTVLGVTSWVPGPIGIASTILDFIF
jgi:hypothetical protein